MGKTYGMKVEKKYSDFDGLETNLLFPGSGAYELALQQKIEAE